MGPVEFAELRRLLSDGSITPASWIYNPVQSAWVQVSSVPELMDAVPQPGVASPPDAPSPSTVYCRFCGAAAPVTAIHCSACGRPMSNAPNFVMDEKTAAIICRASVLATVALPVVAIVAPIIVWGIHSNDQAIVREARAAVNCHITMMIVSLVAFMIGVVGLVVFIGPIITALILLGLYIYAIVVGIRGLIATSKNEPFEYPFSVSFIR
ncbi:MAG: hypothetical protein RLY21_1825 [Planctomycetota bacterium]